MIYVIQPIPTPSLLETNYLDPNVITKKIVARIATPLTEDLFV